MSDTPQPEYCDCDGHHDGSCHQRRIDDLRAALERAERDRNLLADEVRAWRVWYLNEMDILIVELLDYQNVMDRWKAVDAEGVLDRAPKEQQ